MSARDYKRTRRTGSPAWRGFGYGLALGLIIAGAVFVRDHRSKPAVPSHPVPGARRAHNGADDAGPPDDPQSSTAAADSGAGDTATAGSGTTAVGAAAGVGGFDFYRMLPKLKVVVPQREHGSRASSAPAASAAPAAPIATPGTYFLQVGSYHDDAVAERVRAKLAKQGITATVQGVTVDTDVWHRVRVGPIRDLALLNRLRQQLRASNLGALVIRVDD